MTEPPEVPDPTPALSPRWQALCFEERCGKVWRWDVREVDGKRESRRVEVRRL